MLMNQAFMKQNPKKLLLNHFRRLNRVCGQLHSSAVKWKSHPVSLREKLTHSENSEHSDSSRWMQRTWERINEKFFAPTRELFNSAILGSVQSSEEGV